MVINTMISGTALRTPAPKTSLPVLKETPKDLEGVMGRLSCCTVSGDMKLCVAPGVYPHYDPFPLNGSSQIQGFWA